MVRFEPPGGSRQRGRTKTRRAIGLAIALGLAGAIAPAGLSVAASSCIDVFSDTHPVAAPLPSWLRPGVVLLYSGQANSQSAYAQHLITSTADGEVVDALAVYTVEDTGAVESTQSDSQLAPYASGAVWVSPKALAACPMDAVGETDRGQVSVERGSTTVGDTSRPTVTVDYTLGPESTDIIYDDSTGLALAYRIVIASDTAKHPALQKPPLHLEEEFTLSALARMPAPFDQNAPLPSWVRPGGTMRYGYRGSAQTGVNAQAGVAPIISTGSVVVKFLSRSRYVAKAEVDIHSAVGGIATTPTSTDIAAGGWEGVYWVPPALLGRVKGTETLFSESAVHDRIVATRSGASVDLTTQFGNYTITDAYSLKTGALEREVDNNGSAPADAALGLSADTDQNVYTLVSGG
jgi:hypothetical protein